MHHDPEAPSAILSPHPDDAVLSAWWALRAPPTPIVVNVCTGVPPAGTAGTFDAVLGVDDSAALAADRLAEDAAVLGALGCPSVGLGHVEQQYRRGTLDPTDLALRLRGVLDGVDHLVAPAGLGAHPDHVATRDAALLCGAAAGVPVTLYADLPYAVWAGWPHWVTGTEPLPYLAPEVRWAADLATLPGGPSRLQPRVHRLSSVEADAKLAALTGYVTQFAVLNAGPLDRLRNPAVIGYEVSWDVSSDVDEP